MTNTICIKLQDREIHVDVYNKFLTHSTVQNFMYLPAEANIVLSYEENGVKKGCQTLIARAHKDAEPQPCYRLPDDCSSRKFYVESSMVPSRTNSNKRNSLPTTHRNQVSLERRWNPYYPPSPPRPAPTPAIFSKWMFYLYDHFGKAATICVDPRYFVTFRHGTHRELKLGDTLKMYCSDKETDEQKGIEVTVTSINEKLDFILLKSQFNVVDKGPTLVQATESENFTLAGYGNDNERISYLHGRIHSLGCTSLKTDRKVCGPFILGTSPTSRGYAGGGVWSSRGLIGTNCGCPGTPYQLRDDVVTEVAMDSPKNLICSSSFFDFAIKEDLLKESKNTKVPQKKPRLMVFLQ